MIRQAKGEARLQSLYSKTFRRLAEHEATFRAAIRQSLEPSTAGARRQDAWAWPSHGALLQRAVSDSGLTPAQSARLVQALSLTFGIEAMIVLKDICGLDDQAAEEVAIWAASALLQAARRDAGLEHGVSRSGLARIR